mgnify:CR=1 FL=1
METNAEQTAGTVLIVDDNMINRAVLENIFAPQYTVIEAENGKEALDMLMEHREEICAVILDVIMPVMDGIEALGFALWRKKEKYLRKLSELNQRFQSKYHKRHWSHFAM